MSDTTWKEIIPIVSQSICSYLKIEFPTIQIHKSLSKKSTREKDTEDWNIITSFFKTDVKGKIIELQRIA